MQYIHLPPFAKQILGAVVGAMTALVLYGAYEVVSPYLPRFSEETLHTSAEPEPAVEIPKTGERWQEVIERSKKNLKDSDHENL